MDVESGRKLSECKLNPSCRGLSSTSMIELIDIDYFIVTPRDSGLKSPSFWLISLVLDRLAKYLQLTLEIITCGHLQHSLAASSWKIHVHFWFVAKSTCTNFKCTHPENISQQISTGCIMSRHLGHEIWSQLFQSFLCSTVLSSCFSGRHRTNENHLGHFYFIPCYEVGFQRRPTAHTTHSNHVETHTHI